MRLNTNIEDAGMNSLSLHKSNLHVRRSAQMHTRLPAARKMYVLGLGLSFALAPCPDSLNVPNPAPQSPKQQKPQTAFRASPFQESRKSGWPKGLKLPFGEPPGASVL